MFTGLIEEIGLISNINTVGTGLRLTVKAEKIMDDLKIDDSVSINGVCQTVVKLSESTFDVVSVEETIRKTNFLNLKSGQKVNLERALRIGDRLGGHFVQGHVDNTGIIKSIKKESVGILVHISYPSDSSKYLIQTGSISINGVSLTIAQKYDDFFVVSVIPHTWDNTSFKYLNQNDKVNLEYDMMGKYLENLVLNNSNKNQQNSFLSQFIDQPDY